MIQFYPEQWIGKSFGNLVVIDTTRGRRQTELICRCVCGNTKQIEPNRLTSGTTNSCGCRKQPRYVNIIRQTFGYFTAVEATEESRGADKIWIFECICGTKVKHTYADVKKLKNKSCGCRKPDGWQPPYSDTVEYRAWLKIRERCNNPNDKSYHRYGGRGISVSERWSKFYTFIKDMGERPGAGYSIERVNNNGNYEPSNCRWATAKEQANNTRGNHLIEIDGKKRNLTQWSEISGINMKIISKRLNLGWSKKDSVFLPTLPIGKKYSSLSKK